MPREAKLFSSSSGSAVRFFQISGEHPTSLSQSNVTVLLSLRGRRGTTAPAARHSAVGNSPYFSFSA